MARPKTLDDAKRKMVSVPAALAQAIEDYRFTNRLKTEAEAIRRLIEAGLKAGGKKTSAEPSAGGPEPGGSDKPAPRARRAAPEPKAAPISKEA